MEDFSVPIGNEMDRSAFFDVDLKLRRNNIYGAPLLGLNDGF
jgi:hypothetical protein